MAAKKKQALVKQKTQKQKVKALPSVPEKNKKTQVLPSILEKASAKANAKATAAGEPYIQVLGVELDPSNPTYGAFSLDWNSIFVKQLQELGYNGPTEEAIIDQWFKTICHHVLKDTYESYQAQTPGNGRRTQMTRLDKDRLEAR